MTNKCINSPCDWWWCKTHNECLHHVLSDRKKPEPTISRIEDSDDAWNFTVALRKINKARKENNSDKKFTTTGEVIRCSNIYCGTDANITQHHLIPNPYRKKIEGGNKKIPLCWNCHTRIHRLKTNKELAFLYNTKDTVLHLLSSDVKFRVERMMNVARSDKSLAMVA